MYKGLETVLCSEQLYSGIDYAGGANVNYLYVLQIYQFRKTLTKPSLSKTKKVKRKQVSAKENT